MSNNIKRLGDIATFINGYAFKPEQWDINGKPIIRIQNLNKPNAEYNYYNGDINEKYIVRKGDILISWSASIGVYEWQLDDALLNQHIFKVDFDKESINKKYFKFITEIALERAIQYMHGSTMKHITKKYFDEIVIPIPDLHIQERVADCLGKAKELIDKRKAQIEALDELVKSQFIEMFGDPISNPKKWVKLRLKDIVTDDCTISYGIVQTGDEQKEGIPVFRPVDIVKDKKPILSNLKKTAIEISNKYKKTILKGNELLITVRANIGDVFVIDKTFEGCNVGRGITPIRVKETLINIIFFKYQFKSYGCQRELKALAKGITLIQLNMEDLREFSLIVPPIQLQNQFSDFVNQVDKLKVEMQASLKELEDNFNYLMQKAFKGELFENID